MKIVSFNINGLRARPHQLAALIERHQPDVIGLQETKVADDQFPQAEIEALGYHVHYHGQKGHYGVALLSRQAPLELHRGFPSDGEESQRRFIWGTFSDAQGNPITVMNGYFPQGENREHPTKFPAKQRFYADLQSLLENSFKPEQALVVMGDINISPEDCDIGIGEENRKRWLKTGKCSFLPEEREWLATLKNWGLVDSFRALNPEVNDRFSWFDYRSRGFEDNPKRGLRIDVILASRVLQSRFKDAGIDYDLRGMEKPSDHARSGWNWPEAQPKEKAHPPDEPSGDRYLVRAISPTPPPIRRGAFPSGRIVHPRPLQLHSIAIRVEEVQRPAVALGAEADFRGNLRDQAEPLEMGDQHGLVERLDAHAEMVEVAPFPTRSRTALPAERPGHRDQIEHRRAQAQMGQLQVIAPLHHHATEDIAIERDAAFQVADPQDDVIETFDDEGLHGHSPLEPWTMARL